MNILVINHYAGSSWLGMEFRPYYLGKEWVKQGHHVCIIGGSFSHLRQHQPEVPKDCTIEDIDGIKYCWLKTPEYSSSGIKRFWSMIIFVLKLYKYQKQLISLAEPDVVIASSTYPLDIYPAHSIAKKAKAKLCFELHDMWPLSPMEIGGYSKRHPFIVLMQAGENYVCKHSDYIVSLLGNSKNYLIKHGMHPDKWHYVTNGFDMDEYLDKEDIPEEIRQFLAALKKKNKFIFGYSGGVNPSNSMKLWIETAKLLKDNDEIIFVCVGKGRELTELQLLKEKFQLTNVYFFDPIPKKAIPVLLSYFDLTFIGGVKSSLSKYGMAPNKLTDYMLAGKPVILSFDIENEIIDKLGCGITIPAENSELLKDAILSIANMDKSEREKMGERGREYALNELNYKTLSMKFIQSIS